MIMFGKDFISEDSSRVTVVSWVIQFTPGLPHVLANATHDVSIMLKQESPKVVTYDISSQTMRLQT